MSSDNYSAWKIDPSTFPNDGELDQKIAFLLNYGVLAPSTHNTQPWLFEIQDNKLLIAPDHAKALKTGDPDSWGLYISLGACVENILRSANIFGLDTDIEYLDGRVMIRFAERKKQSIKNKKLDAITDRRCDKLIYSTEKITPKIIKELVEFSTPEVNVVLVQDERRLEAIIENHMSSAVEVAKNPAFGRELSDWLRLNNTSSYDGMPGFVVGNSSAKSAIGKFLLKQKPKILQKLVTKDEQLFNSSPAVVIFLVKGPVDQEKSLECGQVVERLWLRLTELGISAQPHFASIQDRAGQKKLGRILNSELTPLFFMRIGYSKNKQVHTPRAHASHKIMNSQTKLISTLKCKPKSHQLTIGEYQINYVTAGQGKPVLLIHGANIGWPQWHLNLDDLAKKFKVYAIDLPGAGFSTKVNFRKTEFEKDFVNIVDQFVEKLGISKIDIVGSSFGGWIAMRLAIEGRPYINKLVLANPIGFTRHMPMKFRPISIWPLALMMSKTALKPKRTNKNLEKFMRDVFYDKNQALSNDFVDYFYELSKESHNALFISRLAHYSGMRKELFLGEELQKINFPTLIIWGKKDPLMPYSTVKDNFEYIVGAQVNLLEETGHMPPVEAPKEFNNSVTKFLLAD